MKVVQSTGKSIDEGRKGEGIQRGGERRTINEKSEDGESEVHKGRSRKKDIGTRSIAEEKHRLCNQP